MTGASVVVAVLGPEVENKVVGSVCVVQVEGEAFGSTGIALLDAVVVFLQAVSSSGTVCPHDDAVNEGVEVGVGQDVVGQAVVVMVVQCPPEVAVGSCTISDRVVCWGITVGLGVLLGLEVGIARQGVVVDVVAVVVLVSCEGVLEH
eukprot:3937292-Rhodomonas_salina.1